MMVKQINRLRARRAAAARGAPEDVVLLREIRDALQALKRPARAAARRFARVPSVTQCRVPADFWPILGGTSPV